MSKTQLSKKEVFCLVGKSDRWRSRRWKRERTSNKLCLRYLYILLIHWHIHGFVNLYLGWDKGVLVLYFLGSKRESEKMRKAPPRNSIWELIQRLWVVRMNCKYTFTLEYILTLQFLKSWGGEREREKNKNIFFPKKCPKRNL